MLSPCVLALSHCKPRDEPIQFVAFQRGQAQQFCQLYLFSAVYVNSGRFTNIICALMVLCVEFRALRRVQVFLRLSKHNA